MHNLGEGGGGGQTRCILGGVQVANVTVNQGEDNKKKELAGTLDKVPTRGDHLMQHLQYLRGTIFGILVSDCLID